MGVMLWLAVCTETTNVGARGRKDAHAIMVASADSVSAGMVYVSVTAQDVYIYIYIYAKVYIYIYIICIST